MPITLTEQEKERPEIWSSHYTTVGEMISDIAIFRDGPYGPKSSMEGVKTKVLEAVLYIICNRCSILDRQVYVNISPEIMGQATYPFSGLTITDVKLRSVDRKKSIEEILSDEKIGSMEDKDVKDVDPVKTLGMKKSGRGSLRKKRSDRGTSSKKASGLHEKPMEDESEESDVSSDMEEKLLIVERSLRKKLHEKQSKEPVSIVTREQFDSLMDEVVTLQKQYGAQEDPSEQETIQRLQSGDVTLSDPLAAVNIANRLCNIEKTIETMMNQLTQLYFENKLRAESDVSKGDSDLSDETSIEGPTAFVSANIELSRISASKGPDFTLSTTDIIDQALEGTIIIGPELMYYSNPNLQSQFDLITFEDLGCFESMLQDEFKKIMQERIRHIQKFIDEVDILDQHSEEIDGLKQIPNIIKKIEQLATSVHSCRKQIYEIEELMIPEMTLIQTKLNDMTNMLEDAFATRQEQLDNPFTDPEKIKDLSQKFTKLESKLIWFSNKQMDVHDVLNISDRDVVQVLHQHMAQFKVGLIDREEFEEKLALKMEVKQTNQHMYPQFYYGVLGYLEDKFEDILKTIQGGENLWQKLIDAMYLKLDGTANETDMLNLEDDIENYIKDLNDDLDFMINVCKAEGLQPIEYYNYGCLSCGDPDKAKAGVPLMLISPRKADRAPHQIEPVIEGAKSTHVCYPEKKITHPIDERAKTCRKVCGWSPKDDIGFKLHITRLDKVENIDIPGRSLPRVAAEDDDKVAKLEQIYDGKRPCAPCNIKRKLIDSIKESSTEQFITLLGENRGALICGCGKEDGGKCICRLPGALVSGEDTASDVTKSSKFVVKPPPPPSLERKVSPSDIVVSKEVLRQMYERRSTMDF